MHSLCINFPEDMSVSVQNRERKVSNIITIVLSIYNKNIINLIFINKIFYNPIYLYFSHVFF